MPNLNTPTAKALGLNSSPLVSPAPMPSKPAPPPTPSPMQQTPQPTPTQQGGPVTLQDGTNLDGGVIKVLHAIRNVESNGDYNAVGDNGSSLGGFQWNNDNKPLKQGQLPTHFIDAAKKYGFDPTDFSPANQNKVAYHQIADYKAQGLTPIEIDALWNGAHKDTTTGKYVHNNVDRLTTFQNALQQEMQGGSSNTAALPEAAPTAQENPSLGGFGGNVVKSGANFLGNLANAAIHPIKTIQGIGSTVAGGLQELGGQQNENTQAFDSLKDYFVQRYNSPQALLHTAYTDPIGLAADVSAALGVGGGVVGALGKGAELAGAADIGAGIGRVAGKLGKASEVTNPLTPVIKGAGKVLSSSGVVSSELGSQLTGFEPQTIDKIVANPEAFTPEAIANSSRTTISQQIASVLQSKIAEKAETGAGYAPFRETPIPVETTPAFLDNAFRKAGVNVKDGVISATSASAIRSTADINKLQGVYNLYKSDFLNGTIDSNKLLNLRSDLADMAYNDAGFKSTKLAAAGEQVRSALNNTYRSQIPGLAEKDIEYSTQTEELKTLRKGLLDKEGNLLETATNKIANATGKGKDKLLARLEEILPGIGKKLEVLKAIEDIQKAGGTKVGTYPSAFLKAGGVMAGAVTGNIPVMAASAATMIIASPGIAVPLLRLLGGGEPLAKAIMAHLAKFATIGAVSSASSQQSQGSGDISQPPTETPSPTTPQDQQPTPPPQSDSLSSNANDNFNTAAALQAGYSTDEIKNFLSQQPSTVSGDTQAKQSPVTLSPYAKQLLTELPKEGLPLGAAEKVGAKAVFGATDIMKDALLAELEKHPQSLKSIMNVPNQLLKEKDNFVQFLKEVKNPSMEEMKKGMEIVKLIGGDTKSIADKVLAEGQTQLKQLRDAIGRFK